MLEVKAMRMPLEVARRPSTRGFTLVELLTTMVVMALMLAVGVPSFQSFVASQRTKSAATELMSALMIARSEAVKRNATVTVAPLAAGSWGQGWTVMRGTLLLNQQEALQGLTVSSFDAACALTASISSVEFAANGRPAASGCFKIAGAGTTTARCVKVDLTGIPSSGTC
jgi:type IV fimbrial biogenesis protein FimT